mmetsp:Transcript_22946/g.33278  ORF Transcript_22946/g.33278 Transcript_22946/m.33278 type:complete len:228 (-) Transcript_22946:605-1288(-)
MEDEADPGTPMELRHLDSPGGAVLAVDGRLEVGGELGEQREQQAAALAPVHGVHGVPQRAHLLGHLHGHLGDLLLDFRQRVSDVVHQHGVQGFGQGRGGAPVEEVLVSGVLLEEPPLPHQALLHVHVAFNVPLPAVHHGHVPAPERDHPVLQHVRGVGPRVHEVQLGQHANGPVSLRIHLPGQLEGIGVRQVGVGRCDCQDNTLGVGNELQAQLPDLVLDVQRLVPH